MLGDFALEGVLMHLLGNLQATESEKALSAAAVSRAAHHGSVARKAQLLHQLRHAPIEGGELQEQL